MLASLNSVDKEKNRLIEITSDGVITEDEYEDFELPVLFRTFFTDDEIKEILMRELKACHEQIPRDTKAFVRRYANEIADEMVKEV